MSLYPFMNMYLSGANNKHMGLIKDFNLVKNKGYLGHRHHPMRSQDNKNTLSEETQPVQSQQHEGGLCHVCKSKNVHEAAESALLR